MIIDLPKFLESERPTWTGLEQILARLEDEPNWRMDLAELKHFHYLYERTSADLGKIVTFASEPETRRYLESLVGRAYGEIHESRAKARRLDVVQWFFQTFPQTFRRHIGAFWLTVAVTIVGCLFGGLALALDPEAKAVIMPFEHLQGSPSERVAREEQSTHDRLAGERGTFSAALMTHNTHVAILALALGATWGVGTIVLLFYNGVILGAVSVDYILAGQTKFLAGWLLPHGSFEIPAILIAGQGGLILGRAIIGWGTRVSLKARLRAVSIDLVTLIFGAAVLLVWAGLVESFLSQYHEPVIPYSFKIIFGLIELALLSWLLGKSGASAARKKNGGRMIPASSFRVSTLVIRTPDGIAFSLPLACPVTRCLAWFIDFACIMGMISIVSGFLRLAEIISADLARALVIIGYFVVQIGYGMVCEWLWRGQTVGKRLLRLRVVDAEGLHLQFSQVALRNLLRFVDMLPAFYMVGGVVSLLNSRAQRLGDFVANTIVIRQLKLPEPDVDQLMAGKYNSLRDYPHLEARLRQRVSPREAGLALQALLRRDQLDPSARLDLFEQMASHFRTVVVFPAEACEGITAEQYVRNIVDVLFRPRVR